MIKLALAALFGVCVAQSAMAADSVKIGVLTTLSGPEAVLGNPMRDSAKLALEMLGGKIGGLPATLVFGDDEQKPNVGRQVVTRMLEKDHVDFMTGMLGANVLLAVYRPIIESHTIIVSANTGPHQLAGKDCSPYFFSTSQQTDEPAEAMGQYVQSQHVDNVYLMAPNYNSGKDMIAGFKRFYKGKVAGEVYTAFGQLDYQAEIGRIKAVKPNAVFVFYPGGMGIQFLKQYAQAGLRGQIPLYSVYAVDATTLPQVGDAALGDYSALYWSRSLDNPRNKLYVEAFRKKYGYEPSSYGAGTFDAIFLIDSAVKAVHGNLQDKNGLIAAMEKANFPSVRGHFTYNVNHFPIENFYLMKAVKGDDGKVATKIVQTIFTSHKDSYYQECHMKAE